MSATRAREFYFDVYEYHPFEQWFYTVAQFDFEGFSPDLFSYLYYEIDQAITINQETDNMFIMDYDKDTNSFFTQLPDD